MINIGICDDSLDYLEILEAKIFRSLNNMQQEADILTFSNLEDLKNHLDGNKLDVLYLDIMFDSESSIDWCLENLQNTNIQVIFMTDFPVEAYNISEVKHAYYLIKTRTTDEMLTSSLEKAIAAVSKRNPNLTFIKSGASGYTVDLNNVIFIESLDNNIQINLNNGESIVIYSTLKSFLNELPPNFIRCHKSYVVNMNHITLTKPYQFILKDSTAIPIPPKKYGEIVSKYKRYISIF